MRKLIAMIISCAILLSACGAEKLSEGAETPTPRPTLSVIPSATPSDTPVNSTHASGETASETPKVTENPEVIDYEMSGDLTVYTFTFTEGDMSSPLYKSVQEYMRLHPNVNIELDVTANDYVKYSELLNNGSMSGVVDISNIAAVSGKGFADLSELMKNDGSFYQEDYYMNVINAFRQGSELKFLCTSFNFDGVYSVRTNLSVTLLEDFQNSTDMSYFDMVQLYRNYANNEMGSNEVYFSAYYNPYEFLLYTDSAIDFVHRRANIDNPDTKNLIELSKSISLSDWVTALPQFLSYRTVTSSSREGRYEGIFSKKFNEVFHNVFVHQNTSVFFFPYKSILYSAPKHISTNEGSYLFSPNVLLSITESYPDKALAWDFLKLMMAEVEPDNSRWAFQNMEQRLGKNPVNVKSFEAYQRTKLAFEYDDCKEAMGKTPTVSKEMAVENTLLQLQEFASELDRTSFFFNSYKGVMWSELYRYLNDEITLDAAASAMQFRLQEQLD